MSVDTTGEAMQGSRNRGEISLTPRSAVARRQLHASVGAIMAIALIASATILTLRMSTPAAEQQTVAHAPPVVVRTIVRQAPPQRMQAKEQFKVDRGS